MSLGGPQAIRGKVILQVGASLLAVMVIVMVVYVAAFHSILAQSVSDALEERLDEAAADVTLGHYQDAIDLAGSDVIRIVDADDKVFAASPYASNPPASSRAGHLSELLNIGNQTIVLTRTVESPDGPMTIEAEAAVYSSEAGEPYAIGLTIAALMLVFLVTLLVSRAMTSRTLAPVETMRKQVEAIDVGNLSERIPVPENDPDLAGLAGTFNGLLDQVEEYSQRQRRFLSDASHELKSPITAIGITVAALRQHPDTLNVPQGLSAIADENERMRSLVNDLLMMARSDEGMLEPDLHPIDLYDLIMDEVATVQARTGVHIDTSSVAPVVCRADSELLEHALRNLLDNATNYAASSVHVSCQAIDDVVRICISDDGPGIAPEDRERAFERFTRLEPLQGGRPVKNSTGLGLAVVREVAAQHKGKAYFDEPTLGGATAVLEIPL